MGQRDTAACDMLMDGAVECGGEGHRRLVGGVERIEVRDEAGEGGIVVRLGTEQIGVALGQRFVMRHGTAP